MDKNLILKAIHAPEVVRLICTGLDFDTGPLTLDASNSIAGGVTCITSAAYRTKDQNIYYAAVFESVDLLLSFLCEQMRKAVPGAVRNIWVDCSMIAFVLHGSKETGTESSLSLSNESSKIELIFLDAEIKGTSAPAVTEMSRLFCGEAIVPTTELGRALLELAAR